MGDADQDRSANRYAVADDYTHDAADGVGTAQVVHFSHAESLRTICPSVDSLDVHLR